MHKRGDTLIEVMFAVAIFGMAAIGTISLMNKGLASTQNTLETTMARQEIDAQAEALRFLHSAYLSEPKKADATELSDVCTNPSSYRDLWKCLVTSYVYDSEGNTSTTNRRLVTEEDSDFYTRTTAPGQTCDDLYRTNNATKFSLPSRSFVLNPRSLDISDLNTNTDKDRIIATLKKAIFTNSVQQTNNLDLASTYPRLLYANTVNPNSTEAENLSDATMTGQQVIYGDNKKSLYKSEGLWITGVASPTGVQCVDEDKIRPDYYDFHIQTCWDSTVNNSASTIESTVRLFNPDQVSLTSKKNSITFANTNWNKWDNTCNQPQCEHSESYYSSPGDHIDTSDPEGKKIVLTGYGCTPANQGTYIDIEPSDTMTVSLNLAVSTFNGHPGGFFLVKLGPLSAILSSQDMTHISFLNDTRTVQEMPTGETTSFSPIKTVGISGYSNVTIVLEKSGTHYKGYIEGNSSEFVEFDNDQSTGLQLAFWMSHYDHCCNIIYKATATVDITLPPSPSEEGGCYRTETPVANNDTIDLGGDDEQRPDDPVIDTDVEETIVASEGKQLQFFDIEFEPNDSTAIAVKRTNSSQNIPYVYSVASGVNVNPSSCSYGGRTNLSHCMYPYAMLSSYTDGEFILYLDRDSLVDDSSSTYFGSGSTIPDFWNYKNLKITIYFYDRLWYFSDIRGREAQYATHIIRSDRARVKDSDGRYWIIARTYSNPNTNYWVNKVEVINQRPNRSPASFL